MYLREPEEQVLGCVYSECQQSKFRVYLVGQAYMFRPPGYQE